MKREVQDAIRDGLTVEELIERLQELDPKAKVLFACDYGDYCHTQQALPVEMVEDFYTTNSLSPSGYSQSRIALDDHEEETEFYCEACDEMWNHATCPKCKNVCVTEDGEKADAKTDSHPIVILK